MIAAPSEGDPMRPHGLIIVVLACLAFGRAWAGSFEITRGELKEKCPEIRYDLLDPIHLSCDGSFFVAVERIAARDTATLAERKAVARRKAAGCTRILRVFRFREDKLERVDSIDIPVTHWVNGAVGKGRRRNDVFIIGDHGNKILRVDLATGQLRTLFEYEKGVSGFKAGPFLFCHKGEFCATGWAYDREQFFRGDFLVRLKEDDRGKLNLTSSAVEKDGVRLDTIFKSGPGFTRAYCYISSERVLYNRLVPGEKATYLKLYRKGRGSITVDRGYRLMIFIGTDRNVFYGVRKEKDAPLRHYLVEVKEDGTLGKGRQIGKDDDPFTYPLISERGHVLVVTTLERDRKLTAHVGKEKEGYRLRKVIDREAQGPMKLSGDGNVLLLMNKKGLRLYHLD
jgi:hypothetical protein